MLHTQQISILCSTLDILNKSQSGCKSWWYLINKTLLLIELWVNKENFEELDEVRVNKSLLRDPNIDFKKHKEDKLKWIDK